jgi:transposase-like protein
MQKKGRYITISDPQKDNRVKVLEEQKKAILDRVNTTGKIRQTAREFGVSPMTVYYIVNPDKQKENQKLFKDKGGRNVYCDSEKIKLINKKHNTKKENMLKELKEQNMFTLLRGLNEGQLVTLLTLKDNTSLSECTVSVNDTEFKQLEVGDRVIDYSNVKSVIFKTK